MELGQPDLRDTLPWIGPLHIVGSCHPNLATPQYIRQVVQDVETPASLRLFLG